MHWGRCTWVSKCCFLLDYTRTPFTLQAELELLLLLLYIFTPKIKSCLYLLSWSSWKLVLWCQNNQKNMKQLRTARLLWSKSPEASNLSVEHGQARPPASDGLHANAVSLPATVKILTLWNLKVALEYFYILMMKWLVSVQCGRCCCSSKSSSASFSLFCFHVFQLW